MTVSLSLWDSTGKISKPSSSTAIPLFEEFLPSLLDCYIYGIMENVSRRAERRKGGWEHQNQSWDLWHGDSTGGVSKAYSIRYQQKEIEELDLTFICSSNVSWWWWFLSNGSSRPLRRHRVGWRTYRSGFNPTWEDIRWIEGTKCQMIN